DRGAERTRRLLRPLLDVELDVRLRPEVDAQLAERRLERGQHPLLREVRIPLGGTEDADGVPSLRLAETESDPLPEQAVRDLLVEPLRRVEEAPALLGELLEAEAEAPVQLDV